MQVMDWKETFVLAFDAIVAHKLRSFLTLLGVIIGVSVVTAVATLIEGANKYVTDKISNLGSGTFSVVKASFQGFGNFEKFLKALQKNPDLTLDDLRALKAQVTLAQDVGAQDGSSLAIRYGNNELTNVGVQGVTANFSALTIVDVAAGRYFTPIDEETRQSVIFLGQDVVKELFPTSDPIGKQVRLGSDLYTVIGVSKPLGTVFGQSQDNFVQIPLSTFLKVFGTQRSLTLYVKARPKVDPEELQDQVRTVLRTRHHLAYDAEDDFSIQDDQSKQAFFDSILGAVAAIALPVTGISLVVGGIVIMNIMLVSVTERTREIGIRKALGARRRDILGQFLVESAMLSGFGGIIGLAVAYGGMLLVSKVFGLPIALPIWAVVTALIVSTSVGLFFGIYPANRAAKLDPIQALRAD